MKTLIIHHLEPCWEPGYLSHGTSFEELIEKFRDHLRRNRYEHVILTRFETDELEPEHYPIARYIDRVYSYMYGWGEADAVSEPERWCDGGTHSEKVLLDDWMLNLPKKGVYISGAFDGECMEDLEIALSHLEVKFTRINHLIV